MRREVSRFVTAAILAAQCVNALAQESGESSDGLAEIVVVAQKRSENLQEVPIAISAFTGASLAERQVGDVSALAKITPNVSFDAGSNSGSASVLSAFIRGIGQSDFAFNFDPGVGVYIDGVYLGRSVGSNFSLFDVERIEILKGPQGTLFGRNTIGGAVNVITQTPGDRLVLKGEFTTGSFSRHDFRGMVSGPITETLKGSLAFSTSDRDGYVKRIAYDTSGYNIDSVFFVPRVAAPDREGGMGEYNIRGKLKFDPSSSLSLVLSGDYTEIKAPNQPFNLLGASADAPGSLGALYNTCISLPATTLGAIGLGPICGPRAAMGGTALDDGTRRLPWGPQYITGNPDTTYSTGNSQEFTKAYGTSATATWEASDDLTVKSISAYRQLHYQAASDYDGSPIEFFEALNYIDQRQVSQELQLIGTLAEKRLHYVLGAYYYDEDASTRDYVNLADLLLIRAPGEVRTKAAAAFAHIEYKFTDSLGITAGGRYTRERKSVDVGQYDANALSYKGAAGAGVPGCFPITDACRIILGYPDPANPTAYAPAGGAHDTFTNFSPSFTLDYKLTPDILSYASFSKGYKSGGWTTRLTSPVAVLPEFGPEKATTYEVGLKSELLERRLRANLAAFTTDYKGLQVNFQEGVAPTIKNAGDARISGFESEVTAYISSMFTVSSGFGYLHGRYTHIDPGAIGITLQSRLQKVPEFSFSLSPRFEYPLADHKSLILLADYSHKTSMANDTPNTPILNRPATDDLSASLAYETGQLRFTVGGTNLTDQRYIVNGIDQQGIGLINGNYNRPREWYASVAVSF